MIRVAHISDLHFASPSFSPLQFFSKRWIGNFYQMFTRRKHLDTAPLAHLADLFTSMKVDYVLITGDLTTTSQTKELRQAADFVERLKMQGLQVITIPGNHDHYTRRAWKKKKFYNFFPDYSGNGYSLKEDGVAIIPLREGWSLIALDTAFASSLTSSQGHFHPKIQTALHKALSALPAHENILVINHFPLFEQEKPQKSLLRAAELRTLLSAFPNIRFYLHGHTHTHCMADLRPSRYPIILDSGSISKRRDGSWNLLELKEKGASVQSFRASSLHEEWHASDPTTFQWTPT